jgi:hypothetical protein
MPLADASMRREAKNKLRITKRKLILAALALSVIPIVVMAQTVYFQSSNTFQVGSAFQTGEAFLVYDQTSSFTSTNQCALGTAPTWSCPTPTTNLLFSGDTISYVVSIESDKSTASPILAITSGTYPSSSYTTSMSWQTLTSGTQTPSGTWSGGYPSPMTSGQWYAVMITVTLGASPQTGSVTFQASVSA